MDYTVTIQGTDVSIGLEQVDYNMSLSRTGGQGAHGYSAYELAVQNGFVGTEQEWLDAMAMTVEALAAYDASAIAARNDATAARNAALVSEQNADTSEAAALSSKLSAAISETNAAASANSALSSQNAAAVSAGNALASEQSADASEAQTLAYKDLTFTYRNEAVTAAANAATSELNADTSEANALTYKNDANNSAISAANSASSASNSATSATTSANSASLSASEANVYLSQTLTAKDSAIASAASASTSAANAAVSESNALSSKTSASNSAAVASTQASAAATSASQALGYRNTAGTYASTATAKANEAVISAQDAQTSANSAATSAQSALDSSNVAINKAGEASQSAANAAASAASVNANYVSFSKLYLGEHATDPVVDGLGNQLIIGATYLNTVADKLKIYEDTGWDFYDSEAQIATSNALVSATQAAASAAGAASSATTAINNAVTATDQAELAYDYKVEAETSKLAAAASATAALASKQAAELAETNAETAETNAETAASAAAISQTAAATSEDNALTYSNNSATSASQSASSAAASSISATNSANSASASLLSATNSAVSASNSAASATASELSATAAALSETNANTSETNAALSASNAAASAVDANNAKLDSQSFATASASSATDSSNSATSSANSASTATTKASEALASAANALSSLNSVESIYDSFDDRMLGTKTADPTLDNDGNALLDGALYWSSTLGRLRIYNLATTSWENINYKPNEIVTAFNTRKGDVTLNAQDIEDALGFAPSEMPQLALEAAGEPTGFENKAESTISFVDATRVFTISPVSSSFIVWQQGQKFTISEARTVTIPNTTGLYYLYFDSTGVLQYKTTYFNFQTDAPAAYIYYNAVTGTAPFFADERHGMVLDWQSHEYLHRTRGAAFATGFSASGYTITGTGSLNSDAQIGIGSGTFFDEDLEVNIVSTATPSAFSWEQDLAFPAKIPVFRLNGAGWIKDTATSFPVKQGVTTIQYNTLVSGSWTTVDVSNNKYTCVYIVATNDANTPVIALLGQAEYANISDAQTETMAALVLSNFPVFELRPLYKLVYQANTSATNTVKAVLRGVFDSRIVASSNIAAAIATDHGLLAGLVDDDHYQYVHIDNPRTISASHNYTAKQNFATIGHTGLVPTTGTNIDQVYSAVQTIVTTTTWQDTIVDSTDLASGSYMVQLSVGSELYTGVMSWYAGSTTESSTERDEIVLHTSSSVAPSNLFLRVRRGTVSVLQIASELNRPSAEYTFKFRRMI